MRKILYILCCLAMVACGKEDSLESQIHFDNIYAIQDDPNDPVKHEIYNIYKEYGVPVYFNDTIGKIFLKTDVNGQPVYQIEKLDLAWKFDFYDKKTRYRFQYIKDAERQLEVIGLIKKFLEAADKALYPFCFFAAENVERKNLEDDEVKFIEDVYMVDFRSVTMVMENWEGEDEEEILGELQRSMVVQKIKNYAQELSGFYTVTDVNVYRHKQWSDLDETIAKNFKCNVLDPDYSGKLSGDELEAKRVEARSVAGRFGFVMGSTAYDGLFTPWDENEDLKSFVKVMMVTPEETFREQWGSYPLVMEKYEILYKIVTEKLGVEL